MSTPYILACIAAMAVTTYVIRALPMVLFRKKITNKWVLSFLYYVPYTVLAAMTFPAVFTSTGSILSAAIGCAVALVLAYMRKSLLTVALAASAAVLITQLFGA
jgi:branched-subunit amino acid transport protein